MSEEKELDLVDKARLEKRGANESTVEANFRRKMVEQSRRTHLVDGGDIPPPEAPETYVEKPQDKKAIETEEAYQQKMVAHSENFHLRKPLPKPEMDINDKAKSAQKGRHEGESDLVFEYRKRVMESSKKHYLK